MVPIDFGRIWPALLYLLPVYTREGNGTEIILERGEPLNTSFKTMTVVRQMARYFTVDLQAAHRKYAAECCRRYSLPLPLRPDFILVPVRARSAQVRDDGTRAFVVLSKIDQVVAVKGAGGKRQPVTRLIFTCGRHLDLLQHLTSVNILLTAARLIEMLALAFAARPGLTCGREDAPGGCPYRLRPVLADEDDDSRDPDNN